MRQFSVFLLVAALCPFALAHHAEVGIDTNTLVEVEGTVREFSWRNPHVYIVVETVNESGERVEFTVQTSSTLTMTRVGWTSDSLSVGDRVNYSPIRHRMGALTGYCVRLKKKVA
ncbi:MAG: hypothetical protein CM1200mP36_06850 [Gammaproteobacteria bacterium]|nr:MAG: hypothetical protein CM1200mP36_06850 [Gammaproteobacteria bacterium]